MFNWGIGRRLDVGDRFVKIKKNKHGYLKGQRGGNNMQKKVEKIFNFCEGCCKKYLYLREEKEKIKGKRVTTHYKEALSKLYIFVKSI